MSIGSWEPDAPAATPALDPALIERLAGYSRAQQLDNLGELLEEELAAIMHADHGQWQALAEDLDETTIIDVIKVLTVAESLPGWEAGAESPVIPLARCLRRRGLKLDRELLLWIREVSDNRFLPYGPL